MYKTMLKDDNQIDNEEEMSGKYTSRRYKIIISLLFLMPFWILYFLIYKYMYNTDMWKLLGALIILTLIISFMVLKEPNIIIDYDNKEIKLNNRYFGKKTFSFDNISYFEIIEKEFRHNTEIGNLVSAINFRTSLSGDTTPKVLCISIVNKSNKSDIMDVYPQILLIKELSKNFKVNFRNEQTKHKYYIWLFKNIFFMCFAYVIFFLLVFYLLIVNNVI